ncbi:hypothetical protein J4216_02115 [Candidatus Woesearchaeota archaeon]|nr:hypothetical protein [Candidatus Woesearchaeota archaeon]
MLFFTFRKRLGYINAVFRDAWINFTLEFRQISKKRVYNKQEFNKKIIYLLEQAKILEDELKRESKYYLFHDLKENWIYLEGLFEDIIKLCLIISNKNFEETIEIKELKVELETIKIKLNQAEKLIKSISNVILDNSNRLYKSLVEIAKAALYENPIAEGGGAWIYNLGELAILKIYKKLGINNPKEDAINEYNLGKKFYSGGIQVPFFFGLFHSKEDNLWGVIMEKVHGTPFHDLLREDRLEATKQYRSQIKYIIDRLKFDPMDSKINKNTLFDEKRKKIYLIDLDVWTKAKAPVLEELRREINQLGPS